MNTCLNCKWMIDWKNYPKDYARCSFPAIANLPAVVSISAIVREKPYTDCPVWSAKEDELPFMDYSLEDRILADEEEKPDDGPKAS